MTQTSGAILGTNMLLYIDGTALSYSTDCSINVTAPPGVPVSHKDSGVWLVKLAVKGASWTASASGVLAFDGTGVDLRTLFKLISEGTTVNIKMSTDIAGNLLLHGSAVCTGITWDAPDKDGGTFSCEFDGLGRLLDSVT